MELPFNRAIDSDAGKRYALSNAEAHCSMIDGLLVAVSGESSADA